MFSGVSAVSSSSGASWLVLRCNSGSTLKLVEALCGNGIDAWSPVQIVTSRLPRRNARVKKEVATLPSFVFIPEAYKDAAYNLCRRVRMPSFSVMKVMGVVVVVDAKELEFMHRVSWEKVRVLPPAIGEVVRFRSGSFEGVTGVVVESGMKDCCVELHGSGKIVKVPPFLLLKVQA